MHNEIVTINYLQITCENIYKIYYEEVDRS